MEQEEEISIENIEYLIEKYMAFLIKTVSGFTGRYISIENDEEFEIALLAFTEAVEKYQSEKRCVFSFCKTGDCQQIKKLCRKRKEA